jgi:rfaE bifunctional protein kinase chain/domain
MENFQDLFQQFANLKVGVIGDVMLDTYKWGSVERISPEAPVPIVTVRKEEFRIGGAGNVALNIQSLGATPFVISVTGHDASADQLEALFDEHHIDHRFCLRSSRRITTSKMRVISRNQQMMRLDAEVTYDLDQEEEQHLLEGFKNFVQTIRPDVVILEDYNKGVLTKNVIHTVIDICRKEGILTAVDPKRKNFFEFRGADLFKPNLKEVKEALNLISADPELAVLRQIHSELDQMLHHHISFITLSEKGVFYQQGDEAAIIPSHLRNIADVSGAGDTVIAVAALVYAASRNPYLMSEIANIAGGLVCEDVGTVAIEKARLLHECELLLS